MIKTAPVHSELLGPSQRHRSRQSSFIHSDKTTERSSVRLVKAQGALNGNAEKFARSFLIGDFNHVHRAQTNPPKNTHDRDLLLCGPLCVRLYESLTGDLK